MNLTRYYMYKNIFSFFKEPLKGKILGVSGIDNFSSIIDSNNSEIIKVAYPDVDMQNLPYQDNEFDYIISDQVLEHIENPIKAINESYRVLKKGGIAIHTTCFMNYIHSYPGDYWRFTPDALRWLCKDFSEVLLCEGWGNRFAILLCFISDKFRGMRIPNWKLSIRRKIATKNEKIYPIVTWIVVKK
jgi:ubiquinone/menaquinone biosynthesis C-methylase UbiE